MLSSIFEMKTCKDVLCVVAPLVLFIRLYLAQEEDLCLCVLLAVTLFTVRIVDNCIDKMRDKFYMKSQSTDEEGMTVFYCEDEKGEKFLELHTDDECDIDSVQEHGFYEAWNRDKILDAIPSLLSIVYVLFIGFASLLCSEFFVRNVGLFIAPFVFALALSYYLNYYFSTHSN